MNELDQEQKQILASQVVELTYQRDDALREVEACHAIMKTTRLVCAGALNDINLVGGMTLDSIFALAESYLRIKKRNSELEAMYGSSKSSEKPKTIGGVPYVELEREQGYDELPEERQFY